MQKQQSHGLMAMTQRCKMQLHQRRAVWQAIQHDAKHEGTSRMSLPQLREKLEPPGVKARHASIDILVFP